MSSFQSSPKPSRSPTVLICCFVVHRELAKPPLPSPLLISSLVLFDNHIYNEGRFSQFLASIVMAYATRSTLRQRVLLLVLFGVSICYGGARAKAALSMCNECPRGIWGKAWEASPYLWCELQEAEVQAERNDVYNIKDLLINQCHLMSYFLWNVGDE